jgi:membrane protein
MREIQLLTETSTQIRVSVRPKAPPCPNKAEQKMIAGTLHSGKCFHHKRFMCSTWNIARRPPGANSNRETLCYDKAMSRDSESTTDDGKVRMGAFATSSTVVTAPPAKSSATKELHDTSLAPGTAARRLQAEDDKDQQEELFEHLPETYSLSHRLRRHGWSTLRYLMQTEVHTYAFSVAAYSILSLFPFIVLLLTVTQRVFHSTAMYNVVLELLRDYLPSNKDFVIRNLQFLASVKGRGQAFSLVMLLITSTGIFLPLEVALNSIWGFKKNRSYLMNLLVSLGLALGCGCLAMLSIALTAQNLKMLGLVIGDQNVLFRGLGFIVMKASAIVATIGIYFLIYWLLPHGKVPLRAVMPAALITGLVSEAAKYIYILALPWLNFQEVYGPFSVSVTLIFWGFCNGMLLLGGAYLSAAEHADRVEARRETAAANR